MPVASLSEAMSPRTKTFGCPGRLRSGSTSTRPARSVGTPSALPSGEAATPVAHRITLAGIHSSPTLSRPGSTADTRLLVRTSTPSSSNCLSALMESSSG